MSVAILLRDPALQRALQEGARRFGYEARSLRGVEDIGLDPGVSVAVLDDGLADLAELIDAFRSQLPLARVILLSGRSDVRARVAALGLGIDEILRKPVDMEGLAGVLRAGSRGGRVAPLGLSAGDEPLRRTLEKLERVAASDLTVALWGESGSGRSYLARALHDCSPRRRGPFVELVALDLEDSLLAETWLTRAAGGTLVLDGLEQFSAAAQEELLALLQRNGCAHWSERRFDARVIAISGQPLEELASTGILSESLARRLDVVTAHVPPLRERPGDIAGLCAAFLERLAFEQGQPTARLTSECEAVLQMRVWRGNVRELENLMARAAVEFPGEEIPGSWLDSSLGSHCEPVAPDLNLRRLERETIKRSLALARGSRTAAAQTLGISVRTLRNKIRRYELA